MSAPLMAASKPFDLERQMVSPVVHWLQRQGLAIKREFSVPWGICDLVGIKLNQSKVRQRLSYGQKSAIGPPLRLHILSKIPDRDLGRPITLGVLRRELFEDLPSELLANEVEHLVRLKFVESPSQGRFQKLNGWAPLHRRLVSVELKLSRISEALAQALSNRTFATESYVALPAALAYRVARSYRADEFRNKGVGLLAVHHGVCRRVLSSTRVSEAIDDVLQAHCVERFWRTRDK